MKIETTCPENLKQDQEKSMLEWALKYARLGWYVLPVHSIKKGKCTCGKSDDPIKPCPEKNWGKHPRTEHGLSDASNDENQITEWLTKWPDSNIGIACEKSGLCALDKDPRNGGDETFRQLLSVYGDLPTTVKANTGGGGSHDLYSHHKDFGLPKGFSGHGLDIRKNAYIVVPPSLHKSGKRYEWVTDQGPGEISIAPAPSFLIVPQIKDENIAQEGTAKLDLEKLSGAQEVRGEKFSFKPNLNGTLQIVVNGESTGAWIDLNGYIGSYSRGGPTIIQWIEWYGYTRDEAVKIAEKYELQYLTKKTSVLDPLPLPEFLKKNIPPVEYYVSGIIQKKGRMMISAPTNSGKTIMAQNLALSIANGKLRFLDKFDVSLARVLYLDLEMGEPSLKERFQKMCSESAPENLFVQYVPGFDLFDSDNQESLETCIKSKGINLLILDPLGSVWNGNENDRAEVKKVTDYLDSLIVKYGISVVVIHHWRKANREFKSGGQMAAGSYGWEKWLDNHITLEGPFHSVTVSCPKNRNRAKWSPFLAKINEETLTFEFIADYQPKFDESTLIQLFDGFGLEKVSIPELIERAEKQKVCSPTTVRKLINNTKFFRVDESKKTHFLVKKGHEENAADKQSQVIEWED